MPELGVVAMTDTAWETRKLAEAFDVLAPDTSEIRLLGQVRGGSMVHCTLRPGQVSIAVQHRTVEEIWYVVGGAGELWRRDARTGDEEVVALRPGVSITLPLGTEFQFRAVGDAPLEFLCCTIPPWPGADEAVAVTGRWTPTAATAR